MVAAWLAVEVELRGLRLPVLEAVAPALALAAHDPALVDQRASAVVQPPEAAVLGLEGMAVVLCVAEMSLSDLAIHGKYVPRRRIVQRGSPGGLPEIAGFTIRSRQVPGMLSMFQGRTP